MLKKIAVTIFLIVLTLEVIDAYAFEDCYYRDVGSYYLIGNCGEVRSALKFINNYPMTKVYKLKKTDSTDYVHDFTVIRFKGSVIGKGCPTVEYIIWWVGKVDNIVINRPLYSGCFFSDKFRVYRPDDISSYVLLPKEEPEKVVGIIPQELGVVKPAPSMVKDPDIDELPFAIYLSKSDWHFAGAYSDSAFYEDENYWYFVKRGSVGMYLPEYLNDNRREVILYITAFDNTSKDVTFQVSTDGKNWRSFTKTVGGNITELKLPYDALFVEITAPEGVALYKKVYITLDLPQQPTPTPVYPPPPSRIPKPVSTTEFSTTTITLALIGVIAATFVVANLVLNRRKKRKVKKKVK